MGRKGGGGRKRGGAKEGGAKGGGFQLGKRVQKEVGRGRAGGSGERGQLGRQV